MTGNGPKISITGAGIGGLALAGALKRAGVESEVFERALQFEPVGAGIVIAPNGMEVLRQLGLSEKIESASSEIDRVQIRTSRGALLHDLRFTGGKNGEAKAAGVHRATLHDALLNSAPADSIHLGHQLVTLWDAGDSVRLYFADGSQHQAEVLVGADGLDSTVRAWMYGASPPRYAGYVAWRGICQGDFPWMADRTAIEVWASGARFGAAPIGSGRIYWWLAVNRPADSPAAARSELSEALAECKYWEGPASEMIAATPDETILRHEIFDRPPIREWSRGRVALLGDAAHPMTPNLGQGANQALEDALVLSQMLREVSSPADLAAALRGYEDERVRRANRMIRQSRLAGRIGQVSWGPAVWARDATARLTPSFMARWWFGSLSRPRGR